MPRLLSLDEVQYREYRNKPGILDAKVKAQVSELEVIAEIPLDIGARYDTGSEHFVITDIGRLIDGIAAASRYWHPRSVFSKRQPFWDHMVLLNRKGNQALIQSPGVLVRMLPTSSIPPAASPLVVGHYVTEFRLPAKLEEQIDDLWFRDARLLMIREAELGTFEKTFRINNFLMSEKAGGE
jgi:hypothetical protein